MKNAEEKEVCFGILMGRKLIDAGIYLYQPMCLIEGYFEKSDDFDMFVDVNGTSYFTTNDSATLSTDDELSVAYILTEEQLLAKYPEMSIVEAKQEYLMQIQNITHIGFYLMDYDLIALVPFDFMSMSEQLNSIEFDPNQSVVSIPINNFQSKTEELLNEMLDNYSGEDLVVMSKDAFDKVLNCQTFEEMKEALNEINSGIQEINNQFSEDDLYADLNLEFSNKEVLVQNAKKLFDIGLNRILKLNDIDQLQVFRSYITVLYMKLNTAIKNINFEEKDESLDILSNIIDKLIELENIEDVDIIHTEVRKLQKEFSPKFDKIYEKYKDYKPEQSKIDVRAMKKFFDEKIIGQEEAKKDVIQAIVMNSLSENASDKNSILLVGPTGSGKTLIAETVSQYLNIPMEVIDTTQLTVPGFKGADIDDFLARLVAKANGDLTLAQKGIVVLDEIDKKGSEKNEDISGKGVLNTLLPFLQGTTYDVKYNNRTLHFDTSKLTIFATGAFTDVAKAKEKDNSNTIGFGSVLKDCDTKEDISYGKFEYDDLVKYGNMPIELIGRFSTITQLSGHTKESLRTILTESNVSALLSERNKLKKLGIDLVWTDGYLDAVASKALEFKTGARSLKTTVEKSIKEARWEVLQNLDTYCSIILTAKAVSDNKDCELIDQNGNSYQLRDILNEKQNEENLEKGKQLLKKGK